MEDKSIVLNATLDSKIGEDVFINHEVNNVDANDIFEFLCVVTESVLECVAEEIGVDKHKILEDYINKLIGWIVIKRINHK